MQIDFDPAKNATNLVKHGLSLADFAGFDADPVIVEDDRYDYGETRFRGYGRIAGLPFCIVFTIDSDTMRLISFRRAREKEMRRYE